MWARTTRVVSLLLLRGCVLFRIDGLLVDGANISLFAMLMLVSRLKALMELMFSSPVTC